MPTTPAQQAHYQRNRERYLAQAKQQRLWWREFVDWLKSLPCADCGIQYAPHIMQFDHVTGEKVDSIARLMLNCNMTAVRTELMKCEIVCANCHADRTYKRAAVA